MQSLRDLQQQFARGLLLGDDAVCSAIVAGAIEPARRLDIYRNNAREGFLKALEATFPVIARLSGADWFRQTATQYMRAHPSTSGNLHYVGEQFAGFLDARLQNSAYAYFADVARLEWAYQQVLVAAEHPTFDPAALRNVAPDDYGALRLRTHPALRLVVSRYPILAIWQANRPDHESDAIVDLDAGPAHLLIIRRPDHVELREIPVAEHALLTAFSQGRSLADAAEAALAAQDGFDLGAALTHLMRLGTLVDFSIDAASPRPEFTS